MYTLLTATILAITAFVIASIIKKTNKQNMDVNHINGPKAKYDPVKHKGSIYFTKDTNEIIFENIVYAKKGIAVSSDFIKKESGTKEDTIKGELSMSVVSDKLSLHGLSKKILSTVSLPTTVAKNREPGILLINGLDCSYMHNENDGAIEEFKIKKETNTATIIPATTPKGNVVDVVFFLSFPDIKHFSIESTGVLKMANHTVTISGAFPNDRVITFNGEVLTTLTSFISPIVPMTFDLYTPDGSMYLPRKKFIDNNTYLTSELKFTLNESGQPKLETTIFSNGNLYNDKTVKDAELGNRDGDIVYRDLLHPTGALINQHHIDINFSNAEYKPKLKTFIVDLTSVNSFLGQKIIFSFTDESHIYFSEATYFSIRFDKSSPAQSFNIDERRSLAFVIGSNKTVIPLF